MITAIDTNILLDVLVPNKDFYEASANALQEAAGEGSLVISDIVYAELCIQFEIQRECDAFLEATEIRVQALTRESHFHASRAWRTYRQQGGKRTRILADFLIGAHAQKQATRLLSRDRGFYHKLFPSLDLHDPSGVR
jgi:predicted nucleic acid-binding protein